MITLGDAKDCANCTEPTRERVGSAFDCGGPGSIAPIYDCKNNRCKKRNNMHLSYLYRVITNENQKGGGGHE